IHESAGLGWRTLPCLLVAIVSGVWLFRFDRRQPQPFFQKGIYSSPIAVKGLIAFSLLGFSFLSFFGIATLALYEVRAGKVRPGGLFLFPYSIASAWVSRWVFPRLFKKAGVAGTGLVAVVCLLVGTVLLGAGIYTHRLPWYL